jgi:hypothetical protein
VGARVSAASGRPAVALEGLAAVLAEATRLGMFDLQLEARLAMGRIRMESGDRDARAQLEALEADSRSRGFALAARKAAAAGRPVASPPR